MIPSTRKSTNPPVDKPLLNEKVSVTSPSPTSGAASLPEKEFAFLQHKMLVRDYLRSRLTYPSVWSLGSVHVRLVLRSDGSLKESAILEATDVPLATVAITAIRQAAPYPPFPQEMKESEASYEFLVQYRPE